MNSFRGIVCEGQTDRQTDTHTDSEPSILNFFKVRLWKQKQHVPDQDSTLVTPGEADKKLADLGMLGDVLGLHFGGADADGHHLLLQQGCEAWHNGINHL